MEGLIRTAGTAGTAGTADMPGMPGMSPVAPTSHGAAPSVYAMMADTRSELVETVAQFDRMIAQLTGMRAEAIEQARVWSEITEASLCASGTMGSGTTGSGITGVQMARRSLVAELACAMRMPERSAEALLDDSRALVNDLPSTLGALRSGSIGNRHARIMVDHAAPLEPALRSELEQAALPIAWVTTPSAFERKLRALRERMDPESSVERHHRAVADRRVECSGGKDGMAWLSAYLPVEQAVAVYSRITEAARNLQTAEETRTLTQLRADVVATVMLSDGMPGDGQIRAADMVETFRRIRPRVMVTVPVLTLLDRGTQPATLEGYGPIDPETARRLTAEAPRLTRLLTHPESGAVLSVGRDSYRVPASLRTWLRVRDGSCRFPNCGRAAANCDLDHTVDWQRGGPTDWRNLAHLCPKHHKLKHEGGFQADDTGTLTWTSPAGCSYTTTPELEARRLDAAAL